MLRKNPVAPRQAAAEKHRQALRRLRRATKTAGLKVPFPARRRWPWPKIISIRFARQANELARTLFRLTAAEKEMQRTFQREPRLGRAEDIMQLRRKQRMERRLLEQGIRRLLEAAEPVPGGIQEKIEAFYRDRARLRAIFNGTLQNWGSTAAFVTEWYNAHLNRRAGEAELRIPREALGDPRHGAYIQAALTNLVRLIAKHSRVVAKLRIEQDSESFRKSVNLLGSYRQLAGTQAAFIRVQVSNYESKGKPGRRP